MNQICCLNPGCHNPSVPEHTQFCPNCNVAIVTLKDRYRPIKSLGSGGFGKTYLAQDIDKLNEKCVIKQFAPQIQGTAGRKKATELFLQEALQLQQLGKHSQIPALLAYFEKNNRLYLVQEFIDGENLLQELEKQGIFSESKIRALLQDLLPILKVVHEYGVIHRDIKPENIMRRRSDGKLILIDFGASKQLQGTVKTGTSIGTFGYAPLEQMRDGKVYPASDLYSLGATCFHLLTGVHPGELYQEYGYEWVKTWRVHLQKPVNRDLDTVLDKLLQKYYQDRYQSAEDVLKDLKTSQLTTKTTYQASHKSSQIPSQQQKSPLQTSPIQVKSKQNSIIPKRRISQPNNSLGIIMWSSIGIFVLGTVFLGTQSEHIPIICKPLDNCAIDEEFSSKYKQVKDIAVTAQKLSESAKNVEELRASQQHLQDAIAQLKTIPTSAKIYNTAQKELSDYQSQLTKIQRRLNKENQAIDSINQAKQQAQDAEEQMGKARTVSEYEAVKEKWDKALAILNDIPSDVFISVTNLKNSYESKKEEVVAIIEDLNKPTPSPTSDPRDPLPFPANDIKSPQWSYEVFNSNSDSGSSRLIGKPNFDQQKREVEWLVEYSTISRSNNETSPKSPLYKINKDLELLLVQQEIEGIGFFAEFKYSNGVSLGKAKLNREGTGNRIRYSLRISDNIWQKWSEVSQVIIEKQ
ncbi:protein kinase [Dolichospermum planctonicum UHCC 0167]|uniref:protein kinase domain-containing protein n=1 Tax=Dolichospermum planctonicum TaxID=136072 RepID=UPI00144318EB|nr:protein kinase [Dolichospermum planctonicum]MCW9682768.1 protein kinase [Dolichospermum planctonicum UHCC 0167]